MTSIREFQTSVGMNRIGSIRLSKRLTVNYHHGSSRYDLTSHVMLVDNKRMHDVASKWFVADGARLLSHITGHRDRARPEVLYYHLYEPSFIPLVMDLTADLTGPVAIELTLMEWNRTTKEYDKKFGAFGESNVFVKSGIYFMNEADAVQAGIRWCAI